MLNDDKFISKVSREEVLAVLAESGSGNFNTRSQRSVVDISSTNG